MRRNMLMAVALLALIPAEREPEPKVAPPDDETFHGHLDKCARCRNQPLGLCPTGAALLEREATAT
jgi:hypothetical protein